MKRNMLEKFLNSKLLILAFSFIFISNLSYSSELNFSALSDFGEVPIYLAVLVEIIQKMIIAMVLIGIISDVLEVVASADFSKLLRSTVMGMMYIYVSTQLVRLIIRIGGAGATTNVNVEGNTLYTNFKIIFKFLAWMQYSTAALVLTSGILFFIIGMFKFVATADIMQLIQSLIMTGLFLTAFYSMIASSINFDDAGNPKGIFKSGAKVNTLLISAKELDASKVKILQGFTVEPMECKIILQK